MISYEERLAHAKQLSARPPKKDQPGQKFPRGARVLVDEKMPSYMSHFECGFDGIVQYTYAQQYGGYDVKSYSLIVLDKNGEPINAIAWYHESQLTLLDDNTDRGISIINDYKSNRS